ncbi:hypothetical protein LZZ85_18150 [Terrimonas sp. NA20]|uniref:Uncharacterized protein n=1 Tax=Terrimonas ginsenosidimutans TaxID=2908004 RepID=A0ABS9KV78_9BACT|nr:hypothetical protein [Terrimonas ginsenosidimutans]MCG2616226.1 hypothetical protein [Terrimonas ginsenosidimutans]
MKHRSSMLSAVVRPISAGPSAIISCKAPHGSFPLPDNPDRPPPYNCSRSGILSRIDLTAALISDVITTKY